MSHSKCFSSGIGESQVKECYLVPPFGGVGQWASHSLMPCGQAWQRPLRGGYLSLARCPDSLFLSLPSSLSFSLPPSLLLSVYSLLFLLISEVSPWEKLDSFYFIVIIHISRIENSQMKIHTITDTIKQLYLTPPEAS